MPLLVPPKKPLPLAVYSFIIFFVISLVISFIPDGKGLDQFPLFMFGMIGYFYGKNHHTKLPYRQAFLTTGLFAIPLILINILAHASTMMSRYAETPENEKMILLVLGATIFISIIALQLAFDALALAWMSAMGAKTPTVSKTAKAKK